jgi:hypothetical protein
VTDHTFGQTVYPDLQELEDYKWASFIHAEGHDQAGSDYELCDDPECPYWPDALDPNEDQPLDRSRPA